MEFSSFRETPEYDNFGHVLHGFELKNGTRISEMGLSDNPAELGIVTGLLTTVCIFNLKVTMLKENFFKKPLIHLEDLRLKAMFYIVLNLVCFCIFSPFLLSSLILLCAYRCAITLVLKVELGKKFVGLLKGTDSVWAVEDATSKSIINILAILESPPHSSNAGLLLQLRELAQEKLIGPDPRLDKLGCLRKKRYGYFYWERRGSIDITQHVRWLDTLDEDDDDDDSREEKLCNEELFKKMLSKLCTQPLPQDNQACWEILVSRSHLPENFDRFKDMEEGLIFSGQTNTSKKNVRIPIIFRVHHTLGDGFALLRLLLGTIADSKDVEMEFKKDEEETSLASVSRDKTICGGPTKIKLSASKAELMLRNNKDLLGASMPFSLIISANIKETLEKYLAKRLKKFITLHEFAQAIFEFGMTKIKQTIERLTKITFSALSHIVKLTIVLIEMPSCLVHQAFRSMDNSALHGPKLSGEKFVSFWIEGESGGNVGDSNLLTIIQQVKNATGTKFGDVILAALSASLYKYFKQASVYVLTKTYDQIGDFAPKSLTVVLPSRMSISDDNSRLGNEFSVGLLPLCISGSTEIQATCRAESKRDPTIVERLFDVARNSHHLRNQSDYLVNFWVMKWLSAILPEVFLRPILESHSTLVFSNVPGPQEVQILGWRLRNIVFWVPHRGTTGIGFSVLSYNGNVHLGLLVDKVLVRNHNQFGKILENTVQEIRNLHEIIFISHFAKSLHNLATASTNIESESCE